MKSRLSCPSLSIQTIILIYKRFHQQRLDFRFIIKTNCCIYRFEETKPRNTTRTTQQRTYVNPSQDPVDEVLFSTMDDAPAKEPEVFNQPYPCMNEQLHNRITEAIQTDDLNQVEKV